MNGTVGRGRGGLGAAGRSQADRPLAGTAAELVQRVEIDLDLRPRGTGTADEDLGRSRPRAGGSKSQSGTNEAGDPA